MTRELTSTASQAVKRLPTPFAREEVIGMVWAAAGPVRVPARCWPMQIALEVLSEYLPSFGRLRCALESWPPQVTSAGRTREGVDLLLLKLTGTGSVSVEGRGWDAGFRPSEWWLELAAAAASGLRGAEKAALETAAQRLVASATTWSKNARASFPDTSVTS